MSADDDWFWWEETCLDDDGREYREACVGIVECPKCGADVELVADTEEWTEGDDGLWRHSGYGPGQGVCCGLLIVDSWDGCKVYELPKET